MNTQSKPPFAPGDTFTKRGQTYKVKRVEFGCYGSNEQPEWLVIAWRFIKTTQKYSGNAYLYSLNDIDPVPVKNGPALLTAVLNNR